MIDMRNTMAILHTFVLFALVFLLHTPNAVAKRAIGEALVVGKAKGGVLHVLNERYKLKHGTGFENPERFDLVIFDGAFHSPQSLRDHAAIASFLTSGKGLVILNNTEAHRAQALLGQAWAHSRGSSPAVAFFVQTEEPGAPQRIIQVDFPSGTGDTNVRESARRWLDRVQTVPERLGISPATTTAGQTVLSFDHIIPVSLTIPSRVNSLGAPGGISLSPSRPGVQTTATGAFETLLYAMLEGTTPQTYQHKIISRQHLTVDPGFVVDNDVATEIFNQSRVHLEPPISTALGINLKFELGYELPSNVQTLLGITENKPEATNNVTQLTTSESQSESVGVSASAGFAGKAIVGTIGASWSESWSWSQATTISFTDWESDSTISPDTVSYDFFAAHGTPNTLDAMQAWNYDAGFCAFIDNPGGLSMSDFNGLQTTAMTSQSETAWATSTGTLIPPQSVDLISTATIVTGEVFYYPYAGFCSLGASITASNLTTSTLTSDITLDYSWPGLQPPAVAPWTLSFDQPVSSGSGQWTAPGTITLNSPTASDTTMAVTWVVQPMVEMLTLGGVCPGNATTFAPGPDVVSNAPTSVTIPAGATLARLAPVFEPIGQPYNVQVVAWHPVGNVQSAQCITVPAQVP